MNASDREQLRLSLLRFLAANTGRFGLPSALLLQQARAEGRPGLDAESIEHELTYLQDKGLVTQVAKSLSPENRAWRITAEGRDFHAQYES